MRISKELHLVSVPDLAISIHQLSLDISNWRSARQIFEPSNTANILLGRLALRASLGILAVLNLEDRAALAEARLRVQPVHTLLKRITLPAKQIVSVRSEASRISEAVDERLLAVLVVVRVGEVGGVVHDLVHDLGDADGVGGRALVAGERGVARSVGYVGLVIRAVEVLAIPAGGEDDGGTDGGAAGGGEAREVRSAARRAGATTSTLGLGETAMADTGRLAGLRAKGWVAREHTEALWKWSAWEKSQWAFEVYVPA